MMLEILTGLGMVVYAVFIMVIVEYINTRFILWYWVNSSNTTKRVKLIRDIGLNICINSETHTRPIKLDMEKLKDIKDMIKLGKVKKVETLLGGDMSTPDTLLKEAEKISFLSSKYVRGVNLLTAVSYGIVDSKLSNSPPLTYDEHLLLKELITELNLFQHNMESFKQDYGKFFNLGMFKALVILTISLSMIDLIF